MDAPDPVTVQKGVADFQVAISEFYFPYAIESVEVPEAFEGTSALGRIGPIRLLRSSVSAPFYGGRLPIRRGQERNTYVLMLVEQGKVCLHGNRHSVANPGDIVLMNADKPLQSEQKAGGVSLAISIPARLMKLRYGDIDDWCLQPLPTDVGSPAILRECLMSCWRGHEALHPAVCGDLSVSLVHLIGAAFTSQSDLPTFESRSARMHFLRIRDLVAEHLENPDLSAEFVSEKLGISKSYLFMIMNAANTTLGRFILEQRLEHCRELLADPAVRCRTISEIAFATGFQELSHFSRRFTERFGKSPRAFRASALAGD